MLGSWPVCVLLNPALFYPAIAERRALNERRNLIDKAKEKQALTIGKTMKGRQFISLCVLF